MTNHKETERAELHKTIWRIANDLRGSVDGWNFKPMCWAYCSIASSPKTSPATSINRSAAPVTGFRLQPLKR